MQMQPHVLFKLVTFTLSILLSLPSMGGDLSTVKELELNDCIQALTGLTNETHSKSEFDKYLQQKQNELSLRNQGASLNFSLSEYERRLQNLRKIFDYDNEIQAITLFGTEEIGYFTGYETTGTTAFEALVVPRNGKPFAVVRRLERGNITARTWLTEADTYVYEDGFSLASDPSDMNPYFVFAEALAEQGVTHGYIAFDEDNISSIQKQKIIKQLLDKYSLVDFTEEITKIPVIKSSEELALLEKISKLTEQVMIVGIQATKLGATNKEILAAMSAELVRTWGDTPAVRPYVSISEQALIGHNTASGEPRTIQMGDVVFLEAAASLHGYHVAMMRPVLIGPARPEVVQASEVTEQLLSQQIEHMSAGSLSSEIYNNIHSQFLPSLHTLEGEHWTRIAYTLGHARPPEWGPAHGPSIQKNDPTVLQTGMVFHAIPWTQYPKHKFAMTISETVIVENDQGRRLSSMPMRLIIKPDGNTPDKSDKEWLHYLEQKEI